MPAFETADRHEDAVLWTVTGTTRNGEPIVGSPEGIRVRWQRENVIISDPLGQPVKLDAFVVVDRAVPVGSLLWLGRLADYNPAANNEIMEVILFKESPDLKARNRRRILGLMKFKGSI